MDKKMTATMKKWQRNKGSPLFTIYGCGDLRAPVGAKILKREDLSSDAIGVAGGVVAQATTYRYRGATCVAAHGYNHCTGEVLRADENE